MSTGFPFASPLVGPPCSRRSERASIVRPTCLGAAFACGLGSTHPCASAVHMEPFSTSVLEGLTRVFATTTKICTDGGSRRAHAPTPSTLTATPPYSPGRTGPSKGPALSRRPGMGRTLKRHPFSGLVASAGELLHTP